MKLSIQRNLSIPEARAASDALDFLSRIGIGQIDQLSELVRMDRIQSFSEGKLEHSSLEACQTVDAIVRHLESLLDYPYGASYGIGHQYVSETAHHAWELKKTIDQTLAMHQDPNPRFRGVNYDGLSIRYTKETAPEAQISGSEDSACMNIRMTPNQLSAFNKAMDLQVSLMSGNLSVLTRQLEDGFLIPFDKKDMFGKPVHEGRPKPSSEQISAFNEVMKGLESTLGFDEPIDLSKHDISRQYQAALSAQAVIKGKDSAEPSGMKP